MRIPWLRRHRIVVRGLAFGVVLLGAGASHAGVLDATWTAPTTNTDGSALTDLGSYRLYYSTGSAPCGTATFFQVTSPTPNPGTGQTVSFRLTGLVTGTTYSVAVSAVDLGGSESACSAPRTGVAAVDFAVSPTGTVSFGNVNVGSGANQTFTVSNTRGGTVSGTVTTSAPFTVVSGSPFTLAGMGASQTVTVRFSPTSAITSSGNVNFSADGDTTSRGVTGTGVAVPDTTVPTVTITSPTSNPTSTTSTTPMALGGTASDNIAVTQVTWANGRGGSGTATGTTSWTASGVALQPGSNVLTVTARDAAGNTATDTLTVTFNDTGAPTVTITSPTSNPTLTTGNAALTLGGSAADNIAVTQVTWTNNRGGSGTAAGTGSWTASGIVLQSGSNVLTVTARDAAGNSATDTLTVTLNASFVFIDDPLTAGTTAVKTTHVVELRTAINSLRAARGLAPFAWTDPTLTPGVTPVKRVHLTQLRTALNQAYQAAGRAVPTYTDPTVTAQGTTIKAIHLNELRTFVRNL